MADEKTPSRAGRKRFGKQKRNDRTVSLADDVFVGLREIGEGSASEGIDKLYREHKRAKALEDDDL